MSNTKNPPYIRIKNTFLSFGLLCVWANSSLASPPDPIEQTLNTVIDQTWANKTPGIQVGLWVPGQGEWKIAKGLSDLKRNKPMKVGMQQPIGSITKTMTGTLILQLVEEGKLSLDDRLSKWYPDAPEGDRITIAMLLNMTSGIADCTAGYFGENFPQTFMVKPHFVFQHELLATHGLSLPRVFDVPGTQYDYSNTNTVLLGQIAESVTGKRYDRLLKERLFKPLGMKRSFLAQRGGLRPPYTHLYQQFGDQGQLTDTTQWSTSQAWAAGGVASTLGDSRRWAIALGTGQGVLSAATQALRSNQCGPDQLPPESEISWQYCLGVNVVKDRQSEKIFAYYHLGAVYGAQASLYYYPQTGAVLVVLVNERGSTSTDQMPSKVTNQIEDALPTLFRR